MLQISAEGIVLEPQWAQQITGMRIEFPFNLIDQSNNDIYNDQSWCLLKSWYTAGGPRERNSRLARR